MFKVCCFMSLVWGDRFSDSRFLSPDSRILVSSPRILGRGYKVEGMGNRNLGRETGIQMPETGDMSRVLLRTDLNRDKRRSTLYYKVQNKMNSGANV